jgi:UDP-N-acetylmuramate: L-alanyl-gamma-D-glutamyl-meso-diaminopimelate ligase
VLHSSRLPEQDELSEEKLVGDLSAAGTPASFIPEPDDIVRLVASEAREGDVILVMSNGAFGGLHGKLLAALAP